MYTTLCNVDAAFYFYQILCKLIHLRTVSYNKIYINDFCEIDILITSFHNLIEMSVHFLDVPFHPDPGPRLHAFIKYGVQIIVQYFLHDLAE